MRVAVYPGSFDPVTYGHLDVIERSAKLFDRVIVAVSVNVQKQPFFSVEERVGFLTDSVAHMKNVSVDHFNGLTVQFMEKAQAQVIVRGLRTVGDLESEWQLAAMNKALLNAVETVFLPTSHAYAALSSTIVKEIVRHGGDATPFVPASVLHGFAEKYVRKDTSSPKEHVIKSAEQAN